MGVLVMVGQYQPGGQEMQNVDGPTEYRPAAQLVGAVVPATGQAVPAGQGVHCVDRASE